MAEWLIEEGIGETRAILVEQGAILEALIEWPGELRPGAILPARLATILVPGRRGIIDLGEAGEALLEQVPAGLAEGARLNVEIVREAIPERGRPKLPRVRVTRSEPRPGPSIRERIETSGIAVKTLGPLGPDLLERAGWSELLEEAATGEIAFEGGTLRLSLTPAMILFDVDGALPPSTLARAGAAAAGRAIRRLGIGGSIGIDLPTLALKGDRLAAAAALDASLPQPFERTAVNGFGFLQVVRRRERLSIPERIQGDPAAAAARALLRLAERSPGAGPRMLHAHPAVAAEIERNPGWLEALARHLGAAVALQAEPGLAISGAYVHSRFQG